MHRQLQHRGEGNFFAVALTGNAQNTVTPDIIHGGGAEPRRHRNDGQLVGVVSLLLGIRLADGGAPESGAGVLPNLGTVVPVIHIGAQGVVGGLNHDTHGTNVVGHVFITLRAVRGPGGVLLVGKDVILALVRIIPTEQHTLGRVAALAGSRVTAAALAVHAAVAVHHGEYLRAARGKPVAIRGVGAAVVRVGVLPIAAVDTQAQLHVEVSVVNV